MNFLYREFRIFGRLGFRYIDINKDFFFQRAKSLYRERFTVVHGRSRSFTVVNENDFLFTVVHGRSRSFTVVHGRLR